MMIEGDGFFAVDIIEDEGSGIGYTRAGNFFTNSDGEIVLGNSDGPRLIGAPSIPSDYVGIEVTSDGTIFASQPGATTPTNLGQISLTRFMNPKGLRPIGNNIFVETEASGQPVEAEPASEGTGKLRQGFLEASNVDPVTELVELIKAQRAFELNSQSIQAADEALQVVANLRRG